jgi:muconolactone delta-isomerase
MEYLVTMTTQLPLSPWMTTELTPLAPHPSDPATMST